MKRLIAIFTVFLILSLCAVPCLAAELTQVGASDSHTVYASYRYSSDENVYNAALKDGKYTITTGDGLTFTVTPDSPDAGLVLVLRMIPVTDKAAYEWFQSCTSEIGSNILPFDIFFINADGSRAELTGSIKIEVTLPDGYGNPVVCYLSTDGRTTVLDSSVKDGVITFSTNHNSYYVIAQKTGDSPQTGDNSNMLLWLALLVISGGVLTALFVSHKKRNTAA